jgi:hypothetical protein
VVRKGGTYGERIAHLIRDPSRFLFLCFEGKVSGERAGRERGHTDSIVLNDILKQISAVDQFQDQIYVL